MADVASPGSLLLLLAALGVGAAIGALAVRARTAARVASLEVALYQERSLAADRLAMISAEEQRGRTVDALVAPVADTLSSLAAQLQSAERNRAAADAALRAELRAVVASSDAVRQETGRLATALRRSELRGRWGEMQLRRLVETAGMLEHVHFDEQVHTPTDDGAVRPDLVIHLADGAHVVVDAKAPIDAYLQAAATDDPSEQSAALRRHAAAVWAHVEGLAGKEYHRAVSGSPDFVVLFLPAEPLLAAALASDPGLLERAFARDVVLATPTTLGALLRTIGHGWRQLAVAANARAVYELGRELHGRLSTLGGHLDRLAGALDATVGRYNDVVGSLESRVMVSARKFGDLVMPEDPVTAPRRSAAVPRIPAATEWRDAGAGDGGEPVRASTGG